MAIGVIVLLAVEADVLRGYVEGRVRVARATRHAMSAAPAELPSALAVRGATKRFGAVVGARRRRPRRPPRRGARAARRQRRRQVDADQVPERRAPRSTAARSRWTAPRSRSTRRPTRARSGSRPSTRISRCSTTCARPTTSTPAASSPGRRGCRARCACSTRAQMTDDDARGARAAAGALPDFNGAVGLHVRRTAPGGRRQPRGRVRVEGRDPRRADRRARRARVAHGARPDPPAPRARTRP